MSRRSFACLSALIASSLAVALLFAPWVGAEEDPWTADEPSKARFKDLDEHRRSEATLEERTREAGSLDERKAEARAPGTGVRPGDPDDRPAAPGGIDDREIRPKRLSELPRERRPGPLDFPRPDPESWAPTDDPQVERLRSEYLAARERADSAIAEYDEMRDENHPRGEPRLEIVRERNAAIDALREAAEALRRAE